MKLIVKLLIFLVIFAVIVVLWALTVPNNIIIRQFAEPISDVDSLITTGPYPDESDFEIFKEHGVGTIICLLSENLPHEKELLTREITLAKKYGIELKQFPMQKPEHKDYDATGNKAADFAINSDSKVYVHCYLGTHRLQFVKKLIESKGTKAGTYLFRKGERSDYAKQLDLAEVTSNAGDHKKAIEILEDLDELDYNGGILKAWSYYRLKEIDKAKAEFELWKNKGVGALDGLGHCALRQGELAQAQKYFSQVLEENAEHHDSRMGLARAFFRSSKVAEAKGQLLILLTKKPDHGEAKALLKKINSFDETMKD